MDQPIFLSDAEAASLEKREKVLMINVGRTAPFANLPPQDPWEIDDTMSGVTPIGVNLRKLYLNN